MATVNNKFVDGNGLLAIKQYVDSQLSLFTHNINIEFNTTNSSNLIDICLTLVTTTSSKLTTVESIISELQSLSLIADSTGNSLLVVNAGGYDGEHTSEIYGIAPGTTSGTPLAFLIAEGAGMVAISISTMRNIVIKDAMISGGDTSYLTSADLKTLNGVSLIGTGNITYDTAFSDSSTNAMQNKAIKEGLERGDVEVGKALQAKSIQAVSEESGTIQETPFVYQGTGTGNGAEVVDTSPVGKHLEKQGNAVVVNNYGNYNHRGFVYAGITTTYNTLTGKFHIEGKATQYLKSWLGYISDKQGHKLLVFTDNLKENIYINSSSGDNNKFAIADGISGENYFGIVIQNDEELNIDFSMIVIDLTQWFNGDIPADLLAHPENAGRYGLLGGAYNTGTLVNSNGRYLECGGRNQFDGEWTDNTGLNADGSTYSYGGLSTSSFIRVNPNTPYYFRVGAPTTSIIRYIVFYDKDKNAIGGGQNQVSFGWVNANFTVPANCFFVRIDMNTEYKDTVCVSLYYPTGDGYNEYYPYEEPKVYDTGTEVLRKAGSVKDIKLPSGEIKRNSGVVDLGTLTFVSITGGSSQRLFQYQNVLPNLKYQNNNEYVAKLTSIYKVIKANEQWTSTEDMTISITSNGYISIRNSSYNDATTFKTAMANVYLYYELATPTTEQGTPFAENIEINDYGTMGWKDTSNAFVEVPQGCKIFYPADYVLLIDSLNSYVNGDVSALAKKSDLSEYVKQVDLSSGITDVAGLTYNVKKLTKVGNLYTLNVLAQNNTGSNIAADTALFTLPSGSFNSTTSIKSICIINDNDIGTLTLSYTGNVGCITKAFNNGEYISINITYYIA